MANVSCIIPAYNEGERIEKVLKIALNNDLISEIIIVNDGSTDNTKEVISNFISKNSDKSEKVNFIDLEKNSGKTNAVITGIKASSSDYLLFLDSDLIGLDNNAINNLINPVIDKQADITISIRQNSLEIYKKMGLDFVSGERVFHKSLFTEKDFEELLKLPGFALESYLNNIIINKKLRIKTVYWDKVISPRKSSKYGFWAGVKGDFNMIIEIIKTIGFTTIFKQNKQMLKLKVNKK
ncbi:MAG: glycosyltransferase family 2 protein [Candidatus Gracilibacteria bacterium]|nr:glycosyltransferase family 2 protein [Candidatus Gracilibacteria bacterium]